MNAGGLGFLGAALQEVGRGLPGVVKRFNDQTAAENRDSIMRWAEEQSYLDATIRKLDAAKIPLSEDKSIRDSQLRSMGANPAAAGSFDDWLSATDPEGVKRIQQTANDMGIQVHKKGGKLGAVGVDGKFGNETSEAAQAIRGALSGDEQDPWYLQSIAAAGGGEEGRAAANNLRRIYKDKVVRAGDGASVVDQASAMGGILGNGSAKSGTSTYSRTTSDPVAGALQGRAIRFGSGLLDRGESDLSPLTEEEARLNRKMNLMSRYRGQLRDEDFKSILEQVSAIGSQRREREAANSQLRGDQTGLTREIMSSLSQTDRQNTELSARADEGAKNREAELQRARIMAAAGRYKADKTASTKSDDSEWKAAKALVDDARMQLINVRQLANEIVTQKMRPSQAKMAADAFGLDIDVGGWFDKDRVNMKKMSAAIDSLAKDHASKVRILKTYTRPDPGEPSPAPFPGAPSRVPGKSIASFWK